MSPCAATSTTSVDINKPPSERAKRDAEKVFSWIKITDVKPVQSTTAQKTQPRPSVKKPQDTTPPRPATNNAIEQLPKMQTTPPTASITTPPEKLLQPPVIEHKAIEKSIDKPVSQQLVNKPAETVKLVVISQQKPAIPTAIIERVNKLSIAVKFVVFPNGSVGDITIMDSKVPEINKHLIRAISTWKFMPIARTTIAEVTIDIDMTDN